MTEREKLDKLNMFHGHVGPFVVVGMRVGEYALERLQARPHFGLEAEVTCAGAPPESCLLDGIQFSTGCTLGKQNLRHRVGSPIEAHFRNRDNDETLCLVVLPGPVNAAVQLLQDEGEEAAVALVRGWPYEEFLVERESSAT
jgi:formylmethanofuran dehydrogenase subunit E